MYKVPEKYIIPTAYRCSKCGHIFYTLQSFFDHMTLKHGVPPSEVWRYVKTREIR